MILTCFYILKLLYSNFIISSRKNVILYVYNQVFIQLLIVHSTMQLIIHNLFSWKYIFYCGYSN